MLLAEKGRGVLGHESAMCSRLRQFVQDGPCAEFVNMVVYRYWLKLPHYNNFDLAPFLLYVAS